MLCPFQRVQAAKRAETEKKALIEINEYHQMNESELKRTLDLGPKNNNKKKRCFGDHMLYACRPRAAGSNVLCVRACCMLIVVLLDRWHAQCTGASGSEQKDLKVQQQRSAQKVGNFIMTTHHIWSI